MKVLVTGSAGFVGSNLVVALRDHGYQVFGADKRTGTDLACPGQTADAFRCDPDIVIHLASVCSTPASVREPMVTFRDTVMTAANVLEEARQRLIPVMLTSSVKARDGKTPYGAAKRMAETWALEYQAAYDIPVVINRPGTIYGPGQEGSSDSGWVAWFCRAKRENLPVVINGNGRQIRDLLHVSDYISLLLTQLDALDEYAGKHIWDVGGGPANTATVLDLANFLNLSYTFGPKRYGDEFVYIGLNDVSGWKPQIHWEDALDWTICHARSSSRH